MNYHALIIATNGIQSKTSMILSLKFGKHT